MANNDIRPALSNYVGERAPQILKRITGESVENIEINKQGIEVIKRGLVSSVASLSLGYKSHQTGQSGEIKVLIKYFPASEGKSHYKDSAQSTENICLFLSGSDYFPEFYFADRTNSGTFLFLQHIGEKTLYDFLLDYKGDITDLLQAILPSISKFQIDATRRLWEKRESLTKEKYESIFKRRSSTRRIIDYIRAIKGKKRVEEVDKNLVNKVIKLTVPIQRIYIPRSDSFRVTHGDPITKNIICMEGGSYGFIDADPFLGLPVSDLSALLSTPGLKLNPKDWWFLTDVFLVNDKKKLDDILEEMPKSLNSMRPEIFQRLSKLGIKFDTEEMPGNEKYCTFMGIFFRSARVLAKISDLRNNHKEMYEKMEAEDKTLKEAFGEMRKNMALSLDSVVNNPRAFEVSRSEYVDKLGEFQELLIEEEVIEPTEGAEKFLLKI